MLLETGKVNYVRRLVMLCATTAMLCSPMAYADTIQQAQDISYSYDGNGNLLQQDSLVTAYEEGPDGTAAVAHGYRTLTVNNYTTANLATWNLGQLSCTQTVKQIVNPSTDLTNLSGGLNDTVSNQATSIAYYQTANLLDQVQTKTTGTLAPVDPSTVAGAACKNPTLNLITTNYAYDAWANPTSLTVTGGTQTATSAISYTADGRYPQTKTNALNQVEQYTYDTDGLARGLLKSKIFIDGTTESYAYDNLSRPITKINFDGTKIGTDYEDCSTTPAISSCVGNEKYYVVTTTFDPSSAQVLSPVTTYFDLLGHKTRTLSYLLTDPNGQTLTAGSAAIQVSNRTDYDVFGRVQATYSPYLLSDTAQTIALSKSTVAYDGYDRPITAVEGSTGKVISTTYINPYTVLASQAAGVGLAIASSKEEVINGLNQQIMVIDSVGSRLRKVYDAQGNIRKTIDPKNNAIIMTYDNAGHKLTMSDPDMGSWSYTYDGLGRLSTQKNAKGQQTTFVLDSLNRMTSRVETDKNSFWVYDNTTGNPAKSGKLTETYTANSSGVKDYDETYVYDSLGRKTTTQTSSVIDPNGTANTTLNSSIAYDNLSRPQTITYPNGQGYINQYDVAGNLLRVLSLDQSKSYWQAISRDNWNRVTQERIGSGLITTRTYDAERSTLNGVSTTKQTTASNGTITNSLVQNDSYQFDDYGNLLTRTDHITGYNETATYDSLNRLYTLLQQNVSQNQVIAQNQYTYDVLGNILTRTGVGTYTYGASGQTGCTGPHQLCYTTGKTSGAYDANGNLLSYNNRTFQWTSYNMVSQIKNTAGIEQDFLYDSSHQRVRLTEYNNSKLSSTIVYINPRLDTGGTFERSYLYNTAGAVSQIEDRVHLYANGRAIGQIDTIKNPQGTVTSSNINYFLTDHLGSIKIVTDEPGNVLESTTFDVWGQRVSMTGTELTRHGFTGHEELDDVGLINMNGRIYDPSTGRFLSSDPTIDGVDDIQGYNRYSYVHNNPLSYVDLNGYWGWKKFVRGLERVFIAPYVGYAPAYDKKYAIPEAALTASLIACGPAALNCSAAILGAASTTDAVVAAVATGAIMGATQAAVTAILSGGDLSQVLNASAKGGLIGGVEGGVSYGIGFIPQGPGASNLSNFANAVAHGVEGAVAAEVTHGNPRSGFLSGFAGAFASNEGLANNPYSAAIVGGLSSKIGGGDFFQGAMLAAVDFATNCAAHPKCTMLDGSTYQDYLASSQQSSPFSNQVGHYSIDLDATFIGEGLVGNLNDGLSFVTEDPLELSVLKASGTALGVFGAGYGLYQTGSSLSSGNYLDAANSGLGVQVGLTAVRLGILDNPYGAGLSAAYAIASLGAPYVSPHIASGVCYLVSKFSNSCLY